MTNEEFAATLAMAGSTVDVVIWVSLMLNGLDPNPSACGCPLLMWIKKVFTTVTENMLTSLFDSLTSKFKTSVAELIPKAIDDYLPLVIIELNEKGKTAVVGSLPSCKYVVTGKNVKTNRLQIPRTLSSVPVKVDQLTLSNLNMIRKLSPKSLVTWVWKPKAISLQWEGLVKKLNLVNNAPRSCRPLLLHQTVVFYNYV